MWSELEAAHPALPPIDSTSQTAVPVPVRRWLQRCLAVDVVPHGGVELDLDGEIRLGSSWHPFTGRQLLVPPQGLVFVARTRVGPVPVVGFDRYSGGIGEMCWKLAGLVPVMRAAGSDTDRSAAGRLAGEALLLPSCALAPWVTWHAVNDQRAIARVSIDGGDHEVTMTFDDDGRPSVSTLLRWGSPDGSPSRVHNFGVRFAGEHEVAGMTVARELTAGWDWDGDDWQSGPFYRAVVRDFRLLTPQRALLQSRTPAGHPADGHASSGS